MSEDNSSGIDYHIQVGGKDLDLTKRPSQSWFSKKWEQLSIISRVFVFIILAEACIIIGLTIQRMLHPVHGMTSEYYSILMLFNSVVLFLFALDGVVNENAFELVAFVLVTLSVTGIITYQFFWFREGTETDVLLVRFISVCVFTPVNIVLSIFVYRNFGWFVYRKIGASIHMIDMYRVYQQTISLLKVDLQFGVNLVMVAWFFLTTELENYELYMNIVVIVLTFVWAGLGWASVRMEKKVGIGIFFAFAPIQPAYIIYKLIKLHSSPKDVYAPLIYSMGSASIISRIMSVIWVIRCTVNFGNGMDRIFRKEDEEEKPILSQVTNKIMH